LEYIRDYVTQIKDVNIAKNHDGKHL
jgi:hypothetical protein